MAPKESNKLQVDQSDTDSPGCDSPDPLDLLDSSHSSYDPSSSHDSSDESPPRKTKLPLRKSVAGEPKKVTASESEAGQQPVQKVTRRKKRVKHSPKNVSKRDSGDNRGENDLSRLNLPGLSTYDSDDLDTTNLPLQKSVAGYPKKVAASESEAVKQPVEKVVSRRKKRVKHSPKNVSKRDSGDNRGENDLSRLNLPGLSTYDSDDLDTTVDVDLANLTDALREKVERVMKKLEPTPAQQEKLKALDIKVSDIPASHKMLYGLCKSDVVGKTEMCVDRFNEEEVAQIDRNWRAFCEEYDFDPRKETILFLPETFKYSWDRTRSLSNDQRVKFCQYIAQKLPWRHPAAVYHKFYHMYYSNRSGVFSKEENELIKAWYDHMPRKNIYSILSRILHRRRFNIYKRLLKILGTPTFKSLEQEEYEWALGNNPDADEYPKWVYDDGFWDKIAAGSEKRRNRLMKDYFCYFYPMARAGYSRTVTIDVGTFQRRVIRKLVSMKPKTWDDPDWEELGKFNNIGVVAAYALVRRVTTKHVPKDKWFNMEDVCRILQTVFLKDVKNCVKVSSGNSVTQKKLSNERETSNKNQSSNKKPKETSETDTGSDTEMQLFINQDSEIEGTSRNDMEMTSVNRSNSNETPIAVHGKHKNKDGHCSENCEDQNDSDVDFRRNLYDLFDSDREPENNEEHDNLENSHSLNKIQLTRNFTNKKKIIIDSDKLQEESSEPVKDICNTNDQIDEVDRVLLCKKKKKNKWEDNGLCDEVNKSAVASISKLDESAEHSKAGFFQKLELSLGSEVETESPKKKEVQGKKKRRHKVEEETQPLRKKKNRKSKEYTENKVTSTTCTLPRTEILHPLSGVEELLESTTDNQSSEMGTNLQKKRSYSDEQLVECELRAPSKNEKNDQANSSPREFVKLTDSDTGTHSSQKKLRKKKRKKVYPERDEFEVAAASKMDETQNGSSSVTLGGEDAEGTEETFTSTTDPQSPPKKKHRRKKRAEDDEQPVEQREFRTPSRNEAYKPAEVVYSGPQVPVELTDSDTKTHSSQKKLRKKKRKKDYPERDEFEVAAATQMDDMVIGSSRVTLGGDFQNIESSLGSEGETESPKKMEVQGKKKRRHKEEQMEEETQPLRKKKKHKKNNGKSKEYTEKSELEVTSTSYIPPRTKILHKNPSSGVEELLESTTDDQSLAKGTNLQKKRSDNDELPLYSRAPSRNEKNEQANSSPREFVKLTDSDTGTHSSQKKLRKKKRKKDYPERDEFEVAAVSKLEETQIGSSSVMLGGSKEDAECTEETFTSTTDSQSSPKKKHRRKKRAEDDGQPVEQCEFRTPSSNEADKPAEVVYSGPQVPVELTDSDTKTHSSKKKKLRKNKSKKDYPEREEFEEPSAAQVNDSEIGSTSSSVGLVCSSQDYRPEDQSIKGRLNENETTVKQQINTIVSSLLSGKSADNISDIESEETRIAETTPKNLRSCSTLSSELFKSPTEKSMCSTREKSVEVSSTTESELVTMNSCDDTRIDGNVLTTDSPPQTQSTSVDESTPSPKKVLGSRIGSHEKSEQPSSNVESYAVKKYLKIKQVEEDGLQADVESSHSNCFDEHERSMSPREAPINSSPDESEALSMDSSQISIEPWLAKEFKKMKELEEIQEEGTSPSYIAPQTPLSEAGQLSELVDGCHEESAGANHLDTSELEKRQSPELESSRLDPGKHTEHDETDIEKDFPDGKTQKTSGHPKKDVEEEPRERTPILQRLRNRPDKKNVGHCEPQKKMYPIFEKRSKQTQKAKHASNNTEVAKKKGRLPQKTTSPPRLRSKSNVKLVRKPTKVVAIPTRSVRSIRSKIR